MLEEGRRWTVEEFCSTHPNDRAGLYRGAGATALGRLAVVLPMGRAVGGTTVSQLRHLLSASLRVQRRGRTSSVHPADPTSWDVVLTMRSKHWAELRWCR